MYLRQKNYVIVFLLKTTFIFVLIFCVEQLAMEILSNTVYNKHMFYIIANVWIWIAVLWCGKRPLCQLSHNNCPTDQSFCCTIVEWNRLPVVVVVVGPVRCSLWGVRGWSSSLHQVLYFIWIWWHIMAYNGISWYIMTYQGI